METKSRVPLLMENTPQERMIAPMTGIRKNFSFAGDIINSMGVIGQRVNTAIGMSNTSRAEQWLAAKSTPPPRGMFSRP